MENGTGLFTGWPGCPYYHPNTKHITIRSISLTSDFITFYILTGKYNTTTVFGEGISSQYVTSQLGQLSLVSPQSLNWVPALLGHTRECHLCQVAGNTVWSHTARKFSQWCGNVVVNCYIRGIVLTHCTLFGTDLPRLQISLLQTSLKCLAFFSSTWYSACSSLTLRCKVSTSCLWSSIRRLSSATIIHTNSHTPSTRVLSH